jgi:hypothetical protein
VPTQRTNLISRIRKAVTPKAASSSGISGTALDTTSFLSTQRQYSAPARTVPEFLQAYNVLPWLRSGGSKKAQSISDIEWLTLIEDPESGQMLPLDEVIKIKHPLQIFFEQPHPFFSWQTIQFIWSVHLDLAGEAFGIWDKTKEGMQIWPITPDKITALPQFPDKPFFVLSLQDGQHEIPYDQVFWMVDPNPAAPYARGSGIAQALDTELNIYKKTGETLDGFFDRQARPDLLISGKGLNPEKTKSMEREWRQKLTGFWNAFKPHFISEEVDVREFKQDFQSVQFIELQKLTRNTIIQILGLPPEIAGINENSNRAMIESADLFFAKWTLAPRLNMMQQAYQKQIVPMFDDTGLIELDYISPVAEDKSYELEVIQAAPYAFLVDEIRERAGEDPLPDGRGQVLPMPMAVSLTRIEDLVPDAGTINPDGTTAPAEPTGETPAPNATEPSAEPLMTPAGSPPVNVGYSARFGKGRRITTGRGYSIRLRR